MRRSVSRRVLGIVLVALMFLSAQASAADLPVGGKRAAGNAPADQWELVMNYRIPQMSIDDIGEEDQYILDAVCEALYSTARISAADTLPAYVSYEYFLQEQLFLFVNAVLEEDALYLASPLLGDLPVKLEWAAVEAFAEKFAEYAEITFNSDGSSEILEETEIPAQWDLEPVLEALEAWWADAWVGVPYDANQVSSVFDLTFSSVLVYDITKAEIATLLETVVPMLLERDAMIYDLIVTYSDAYEPLTEAELTDMVLQVKAVLASMPYLIQSAIPDNYEFSYNECFDADGAYVSGEIEFYVDVEGGEFMAYAEWLPQEPQIYIMLSDGVEYHGVYGWCLTETTSDEAFTMDMGVEYTRASEDSVEESFQYSLVLDIAYNELGQPVIDYELYLGAEDAWETIQCLYTLYGSIAMDQENAGYIYGNISLYEDGDAVLSVDLEADSAMQPSAGLPIDLNAQMYDVFNGSVEAFIDWLSVQIPANIEAFGVTFENLVQEVFGPLLGE